MAQEKCVLCGGMQCKHDKWESSIGITCKTFQTSVSIDKRILYNFKGKLEYIKILNLICERIVRSPKAPNKRYWDFYYDSKEIDVTECNRVNVYPLMKNYPISINDIANRTLFNLSCVYPNYGTTFYPSNEMYRLFFPKERAGVDAAGVANLLLQMGYLSEDEPMIYYISVEGWKKIESLQKELLDIKQGFVAMKFGPETAEIRRGFREAIANAGYTMRVIDEKEHNNQIVPEIFYEIQRSRFVVVDVTFPNYGAYYEAGYAQGLGKQVIVCCKKEVFENKDGKYTRPHFDISQKSMVIWEDIEDLKVRLAKRIEATVV